MGSITLFITDNLFVINTWILKGQTILLREFYTYRRPGLDPGSSHNLKGRRVVSGEHRPGPRIKSGATRLGVHQATEQQEVGILLWIKGGRQH